MVWSSKRLLTTNHKGFAMRIPMLFIMSVFVLLSTGCLVQKETTKESVSATLSVTIRNITKRTLFATCFAYMKKEAAPRWRWNKSAVYELTPNKDVTIVLDSFKSKTAIPNAYGVLGIFTSHEAADNAIYELLPDENKVDIDLINKLNDKTIVLGIEKYGVVGDIYDYSFIPNNQTMHEAPELDFSVENRTGKTLYMTAFIYQKKDDMPTWRYDKSPVIRVEADQTGIIDVDTLTNAYDRKYTRGYLAVFDESEKKDAFDCTYQLLKDHQIVNVGLLSALQNRKVILKSQKYGIIGNVIDFVVKEPRKAIYSKSENIKNQTRYSA